MRNSISDALICENYKTMHTNLTAMSFYTKTDKNKIDIVVVYDADLQSIDPQVYKDVLKQIGVQFGNKGLQPEFTSFILCESLSTAALLCEGESYNDRRYAVIKPDEDIVLLEFQNDREDYHVAAIRRWQSAPDDVVKQQRRKMRRLNKDYPIELAPCTIALVAVNLIVAFILMFFGDSNDPEFLYNNGGLNWDRVINHHEYYRLFTSMFMHSGIEHLVGNMVSLLMIGGFLEKRVRWLKYILVYFTSGILAGIASVIYNMSNGEDIVSVGASGAIFGVIGAVVAVFLMDLRTSDIQNLRRLLIYVCLSLLAGMSATVDNAAHIGGFVSGFLCMCAFMFMYPENESDQSDA